ncbi:TSUP family transporter [Rhodobacteraceae bacterium HSP-20]|uniref:Probable membrane transporter protein n=1 Tax=Paragemmobacter amnigenus TaxID=2852097 RepID=A0ABS6J6J3_9RHOB|nr:TSUP family transporter [Rhodobacter amnigenus]MBU9699167.1 TSUP family transporter [Rhodobacter amnigenus]MBV4390394.1 TSUP family transporter [Rhodobacter amnigenus]
MFEIATETALLLILAAFVAGFVDSIAGGGGLISVPALLLAGANPVEALATNKLQGTFGAGTAMVTYARARHVRLRDQLGMAVISAIGGGLGALVAHLVPVGVLRVVMPVILVAVALFFALKPGLSDIDRVQRMRPGVFAVTAVPLIAAYDGFFGPGTGSFFMLAFVMLAGYGVLKATAHTKLLNFSSNIGSLCVFIPSGAMWWAVGLGMAAAQVAGASLGARLAMRVGARLIKPLLVATSTAMAARLLWQAWAG